MNIDRKKVILYTAAIIAVMTASLLFSLAVDGIFGKMTYNPGQEESSPGQPVSEEERVSDDRDKGGERRMDDLPDDGENAASGNGNESTVSDIRISGDSIAEFYKERNSGVDPEERDLVLMAFAGEMVRSAAAAQEEPDEKAFRKILDFVLEQEADEK